MYVVHLVKCALNPIIKWFIISMTFMPLMYCGYLARLVAHRIHICVRLMTCSPLVVSEHLPVLCKLLGMGGMKFLIQYQFDFSMFYELRYVASSAIGSYSQALWSKQDN